MKDTVQSDRDEAWVQFADLLRNLSKAVSRATRASEHLPTLSDTYVDAIRALVASEGLTPTQLAASIGLHRATITELSKKLTEEGLITRKRSSTDGRSMVLVATDEARHVIDAFARGRVSIVADGMRQLSPRDADSLADDVPALTRLLERLEVIAERTEADAQQRTA